KASTQVAHFTLWIVVGGLAAGLALSVWFSRRLYSPLRQLMDTVEELPNEAKGDASRDEYGLLHTALDHLTSRLNDVERLLHVNRPMIRNTIVHDLLCGTQQAHTLTGESMRLADIALPHPHFNVLVVEWSEANLVSLPPENRQTLQYALLEALVNRHETDRLRLFAYFPSRTRMVLLLNAKTPEPSFLESIAHSAREYLAPQQIACMSAAGEWTQAQGGIRTAYQTANRLMDLRLFQAPSTWIVKPAGVSQENNAAAELESRYLSHLHANRILDALVCVQQLTSVWQNIPPSEALRSLRRVSASTRDILIRMRYNVNHSLPLLVIQPQRAVWHISEYSAAMEALLAGAFKSADTARRDRNEVLLERAAAYIQEHLAEDLSLERIAEAMHFHAKYFSRLFKELSGMNLVDYIMAQRLERAAMMLRHEKGLSIETIGAQVGYNSPQYFNRRFKEAYGMTPREYRLREGTQFPRSNEA
ncbi:MAG TPA: AraC family transcriptional regulator, partial [Clostridia bacterium]|nr:AraC family transcriptional regulator [Clostridia bacterium]